MKNKLLRGWKWIFSASVALVFLGCLDETSKTNAESAATVGSTNTFVPAPSAEVVADVPPQRAIIPPADLSPGISELVTLAQSGVGEEVLLAYVEKTGRTFNPTVDEIIYLKDLGLPETVLAALVRKGNLSDEVAQVISETNSIENAPPVEESKTNFTAPTLIDPDAPSYSVTAEPTPTVNPPQEVNINYFESTLAPYGTWVDVADYGRCWQPTVVVINRSWRPYSDRGRWVYTSAGWYWQSDYSWGWAPFHYGRWHNDHRVGWVWVPGSTWGPAWVSWRYTDSYCGWAPLPPTAHYVSGFGFRYRGSHVGISFDFGLRDDCYTFIPSRRFCDPAPYRHYVPRSQSTTIYQNSVVINNYIRGNNNTIINEGIGRDRISQATRTPIRTVALRDLPTTTAPVGRAERIERGGSTLAVFRPNVATQNSLVRSQSQRVAPTTSVASTERRSFTVPRTIPTRNEASAQVRTPTSTTTPTAAERTTSEATRPTFTRTWTQPSTTARQLPSRTETRSTVTRTAPSPVQNSTPATAPAAVRTQPSIGSRQVPAQGTPRALEQSRVAVTPRENPASVTRNIPSRSQNSIQVPSTRVAPPSAASRPEISQPARVQSIPSPRQPSSSSYGGVALQRSIPSRSTPSAAAPEPSQRPSYSAPSQSSRSSSRVERSIPQRSQSAPSVAPQRSAPASRSQSSAPPSRSQSRSSRDRN